MPAANRPLLPYLALGFGILVLSMSGLYIRWAQAPGPVTSFYRMSFAALMLAPLIILRLRNRKMFQSGYQSVRWLIFPLLGGLCTALDHATWSSAIGSTRIANATLLNYIAPLWVALFAALVWRERLTRRFWLGLVVTMAGMVVVLSTDMLLTPDMNLGNLLAVLSSVFYAGYFLFTQRGRVHFDPLTYVWFVDLFAALGLFGFAKILGMPLSGFTPLTWWVFLIAALISQIGGYLSIAYALGHLPASTVSATMILQPVLSALLAIPLTGEIFAPVQWLGGLAVLAGISLVNLRQTQEKIPIMD